jgi:hypothetical protein
LNQATATHSLLELGIVWIGPIVYHLALIAAYFLHEAKGVRLHESRSVRSGLPLSPYYSVRCSAIVLAPGKTGILPSGQRQAAGWFDAGICRADLGQTCTGQTFIERGQPLE